MKKIFFVLVFMIAALSVNAQRIRFSPDELPAVIKDNIVKGYPEFTIRQAVWDWSTNLVPGQIFVYDIVITDGKTEIALLYDKDGKFIRKGLVTLETLETTDGSMPKIPRHEGKK